MRKTAIAAVAALALIAGCGSSSSHATASQQAASPASPTAAAPLNAAALAGALKSAGLPVRHLIVYTVATDPNHMLGRMGGYASKVMWSDPRALSALKASGGIGTGGVDNGGSIEVYPTVAGARIRYKYVRSVSAALPMVADGYDYLSGTAVLRLSQYLTPPQARAYRAAFVSAVAQH